MMRSGPLFVFLLMAGLIAGCATLPLEEDLAQPLPRLPCEEAQEWVAAVQPRVQPPSLEIDAISLLALSSNTGGGIDTFWGKQVIRDIADRLWQAVSAEAKINRPRSRTHLLAVYSLLYSEAGRRPFGVAMKMAEGRVTEEMITDVAYRVVGPHVGKADANLLVVTMCLDELRRRDISSKTYRDAFDRQRSVLTTLVGRPETQPEHMVLDTWVKVTSEGSQEIRPFQDWMRSGNFGLLAKSSSKWELVILQKDILCRTTFWSDRWVLWSRNYHKPILEGDWQTDGSLLLDGFDRDIKGSILANSFVVLNLATAKNAGW